MKLAWKLHASQQLFNLKGEERDNRPRLMNPGLLQILTALSLPDLSEATEADTVASFPRNRLSLFAKIG